MTEVDQAPLLLDAAPPVDPSDPFVATLIERAQRRLASPGAANATMVLTAAGGWCAPYDPDYEPPTPAPPKVSRLACGCPEAMLETGRHEPGCTVLDIPATVEDTA